MMKTKILLPVLAIVFAVGLAFATVKVDKAVIPGYVNHPLLGWTPVGDICNGGVYTCQVQFEGESTILNVYPEPRVIDDQGNPIEPLKGDSPQPIILE